MKHFSYNSLITLLFVSASRHFNTMLWEGAKAQGKSDLDKTIQPAVFYGLTELMLSICFGEIYGRTRKDELGEPGSFPPAPSFLYQYPDLPDTILTFFSLTNDRQTNNLMFSENTNTLAYKISWYRVSMLAGKANQILTTQFIRFSFTYLLAQAKVGSHVCDAITSNYIDKISATMDSIFVEAESILDSIPKDEMGPFFQYHLNVLSSIVGELNSKPRIDKWFHYIRPLPV